VKHVELNTLSKISFYNVKKSIFHFLVPFILLRSSDEIIATCVKLKQPKTTQCGVDV